MTGSGVQVESLTMEYERGGTPIKPLDGFDLTVPAGALVLLLGPSGCGKTTLLSCLAGILTPTSGRITVGDAVVTELHRRDLAEYRRRSVGVVYQGFNLVPSMTRARERDGPAPRRRGAVGQRRDRARATCSTGSGCASVADTGLPSCPEGSNSALRSLARSRTTPR